MSQPLKLPDINNKNGVITRAELRAQLNHDSEGEDDEHFEEVSGDEAEDERFASDEEDNFELSKLLQANKKEDEEEQITLKKTSPRPTLSKNPEVIDDFFANFLKSKGMQKTLDIFQEELYEKKQLKNKSEDFNMIVPDVYQQNRRLEDQLNSVSNKLEKEMQIRHKAVEALQKMKDEKDYHKRNHLRVVQEIKLLRKDLERLKNHTEKYDPVVNELRNRYEKAMKGKTLIQLDRDKLAARISALEMQNTNNGEEKKETLQKKQSPTSNGIEKFRKTEKIYESDPRDNLLPPEGRTNPYRTRTGPAAAVDSMNLQDVFEGHTMAISSIAIHPKAPIVATVSDDMTWKMWSLTSGKIFMSGEGHTDWISGVDFHPKGTHLCTSSGDATSKLWDLLNSKCLLTFSDHTSAVWTCMFNETGDFIVTASMDHTARLWDLGSDRCRTSFRAHKDSVNSAMFIPYTNNVITCSADKTVQLWDIRLDANGNSTQTLYGHENALNHATVNLQADTIASSDCDGRVFLWDMRNLETALCKLEAGPHPAQKMCFDPSGKYIAVPSDDSTVKIFSVGEKATLINELKGHKDGVHDVKFDPEGKYLVSSSSDSTFIVYQ